MNMFHFGFKDNLVTKKKQRKNPIIIFKESNHFIHIMSRLRYKMLYSFDFVCRSESYRIQGCSDSFSPHRIWHIYRYMLLHQLCYNHFQNSLIHSCLLFSFLHQCHFQSGIFQVLDGLPELLLNLRKNIIENDYYLKRSLRL